MKNTVLPDLDRDTIERLKERFPDFSGVELPKMEQVGKNADETIDRLLGRSRAPIWPWVAAGLGLVALVGMIAAYLTWFRRPATDLDEETLTTTAERASMPAPYGSADRAWPPESTSEVVAGVEQA
jgi:hypothetical protein